MLNAPANFNKVFKKFALFRGRKQKWQENLSNKDKPWIIEANDNTSRNCLLIKGFYRNQITAMTVGN